MEDQLRISQTCSMCKSTSNLSNDNFYYPISQSKIAVVCKNCYNEIDSKLVQIDISKLQIIKKKALRLHNERKS